MKNTSLKIALILASGIFIASCSDDNSNSTGTIKADLVTNYANIAYQNYKDAYDDAVELEAAINTFTTTPTDANFTAVKNSWKEARESYGTTEAFRFANGPIDNGDNAPEGLLNAWPLDENFIDYVDNSGTIINGGIINNITDFPTITKAVLEAENESGGAEGGEKNISVGYHAIEFLLWGQDNTAPAANLPGQRPYTDYVVGAGGTNFNQARRATYLKVCADLLTDNLSYLVNQWKVGGAYRATFLSLPVNDAIKNIYLGITTLISAELPIERMDVALLNADQEDEHSCFSDNTHRDIYLNLRGVINVYQGKYGTIEGQSLEDLVRNADADTYTDTEASLQASLTKVAAIQTPFDMAISGGLGSTEGAKVRTAVLQLQNFGSNLLAGAAKIGITFN